MEKCEDAPIAQKNLAPILFPTRSGTAEPRNGGIGGYFVVSPVDPAMGKNKMHDGKFLQTKRVHTLDELSVH